MIILSSTANTSTAKSKTIALGRVFHPERPVRSRSTDQSEEHTSIAHRKLTNIMNRVKIDRATDKIKQENNNGEIIARPRTSFRTLHVANVKSIGKTLHVPTYRENTMPLPTINKDIDNKDREPLPKRSLTARVSSRINADSQSQFPLPYSHIREEDLQRRHKFRRSVYILVMNPWFELAVTVFILLNTICLSLEHHGMNVAFKRGLDISNHVSTFVMITLDLKCRS